MNLLILSFIAGVLTILAPCAFTLLPVIIGGSVANTKKSRPLIIIISLIGSIMLFTLVLKASTVLINIPPAFWQWFSGGIVLGFGIITLFPELWEKLSIQLKLSDRSNRLLQKSAQKAQPTAGTTTKNGTLSAILIGLSLGPVFSSCSPTYSLLLATVLPANLTVGLFNLFVYSIGLGAMLLLVAWLGQRAVKTLKWAANPHGWFKKILGILFLVIGISIIFGFDKDFEAYLLERGLFDVTSIEMQLLDNMDEEMDTEASPNTATDSTLLNKNAAIPKTTVAMNVTKPYPAAEIQGIDHWINSNGETLADLRGKVVVIDCFSFNIPRMR